MVVCSQTFLLRLFTTRTGFLLRSSPASTIGDEPSYLRCHLLAKTGFKKKFLLNSVPTKIKKIPPFSPWLKDLCAWLTPPSAPDKQVHLGHTGDRTERQTDTLFLLLRTEPQSYGKSEVTLNFWVLLCSLSILLSLYRNLYILGAACSMALDLVKIFINFRFRELCI